MHFRGNVQEEENKSLPNKIKEKAALRRAKCYFALYSKK